MKCENCKCDLPPEPVIRAQGFCFCSEPCIQEFYLDVSRARNVVLTIEWNGKSHIFQNETIQ